MKVEIIEHFFFPFFFFQIIDFEIVSPLRLYRSVNYIYLFFFFFLFKFTHVVRTNNRSNAAIHQFHVPRVFHEKTRKSRWRGRYARGEKG